MERTVSLAVRLATNHADVGSLERTIGSALAQVGQVRCTELVRRLEDALPTPEGCAARGGRTEANGRAARRLVTLPPKVELRRRASNAPHAAPSVSHSTRPSASRPGPARTWRPGAGVVARDRTKRCEDCRDSSSSSPAHRLVERSFTAGRPTWERGSGQPGRRRPRQSTPPGEILRRPTGAVARCGSALTARWSTSGRALSLRSSSGSRSTGSSPSDAIAGRLAAGRSTRARRAGGGAGRCRAAPRVARELNVRGGGHRPYLLQQVRRRSGYVATNRQAIENDRLVPLASSGPTEKAVVLVIARRFKARGMSWLRNGVSALVRLQLLLLNRT